MGTAYLTRFEWSDFTHSLVQCDNRQEIIQELFNDQNVEVPVYKITGTQGELETGEVAYTSGAPVHFMIMVRDIVLGKVDFVGFPLFIHQFLT